MLLVLIFQNNLTDIKWNNYNKKKLEKLSARQGRPIHDKNFPVNTSNNLSYTS